MTSRPLKADHIAHQGISTHFRLCQDSDSLWKNYQKKIRDGVERVAYGRPYHFDLIQTKRRVAAWNSRYDDAAELTCLRQFAVSRNWNLTPQTHSTLHGNSLFQKAFRLSGQNSTHCEIPNSAISAKPIRHHTAKAFIRSIHRSPAPAGARQCGKCPGPFPLAAALSSSTLRKPSGGAAHHFANKAGTRDMPGLSRASSTGRG
jgi:hypothetical protein